MRPGRWMRVGDRANSETVFALARYISLDEARRRSVGESAKAAGEQLAGGYTRALLGDAQRNRRATWRARAGLVGRVLVVFGGLACLALIDLALLAALCRVAGWVF